MTDKLLSLENAKMFQQEAKSVYEKCLARNLIMAIQENERLRGASLPILLQAVPHGDGHTFIANRHINALADALKSNKDSDNA